MSRNSQSSSKIEAKSRVWDTFEDGCLSVPSSKSEPKSKALYRPFKNSVLSKAKKIAGEYRITIERNERLGFIGSSVELPTVFADAKTPEQCYRATQEALMVAVATMIERGQRPPQPASAKKRNEQVNVRLTSEEKILLSNGASSLGFKGISDFIRNAALNRVLSSR